MGLFDLFRRKSGGETVKLPRGIELVEFNNVKYFRVIGLKTCHISLDKAIRQLEGFKHDR